MKRALLYIVLILGFAAPSFAQLSVADSVIEGHITANRVLSASKKYLLRDFVYVDSTYSLTIPAGTIIFGEKSTRGSLIIKRGAKLFAQGTPSKPIIFTSQQPAGIRAPGDWGGIIVCGAAPTNRPGQHTQIEGGVDAYYGGTNESDNSGIISYVRIEFPGYPFAINNEINGLTCGGVGNGTTIDHVQVSYSLDDGFEFFGGSVNAKYLIAFKNLDDDFDTDFGYRGKLQFGFNYRDPYLADQSNSEAFESDNQGTSPYDGYPRTQPVFSNFTLVGPKQTSASTNYHSNHYWAVHQRRGTQQSIHNSVFMGYVLGGIKIDNSQTTAIIDSFKMKNIILAGISPVAGSDQGSFDAVAWFNTAAFNNSTVAEPANLLLRNPYNPVAPDLTPNTSSPVLGAASFTDLTDGFWTPVTYAGAFGSNADRWDAGWANYNPQAVNYNSSISWTSTIKVINNLDEAFYLVFGKGAGATDGLDESFGEADIPSPVVESMDARWDLPSVSDETMLDIRSSANADSTVYTLKVIPGENGLLKLSWDPNTLGAGQFFITDIVGTRTNMKTTANVSNASAISNITYTYTITVIGKFTSGTVSIGNRWNLVSYPGYNATNNNATTCWSNRTPATNTYKWTGAYSADTVITPGVGYWMKHNGARNYTFSNIYYAAKKSVDVTAGWNIVGAYDYAVTTSNITTVPANTRTGIIYGYTPGSGYSSISTLDVGKACWVKVTQAGQVNLPGTYTGLAKTEENLVSEEWGKIVITDAEGKSYILYAASESADLDYYELPPAPPAGMFDVRFGSQRFVENLSVQNTIELTGVEYPVTVRAEKINLNIADVYSGSLVNAKLGDGEELAISNSAIEKLVVSATSILPTKFELLQNYPNPFNPATTIKFSVPQTGFVKLSVYNSLGQKVDELVNGVVEAGNHTISWNASRLASGVYFYELVGDKFSSVKKMMFIK
jgi:hypothetical protein